MYPAPDYQLEQLVHQQRREGAARVRQARHLQKLQKQRKPKTHAWDRLVQLLVEATPRRWPATRTARGEA